TDNGYNLIGDINGSSGLTQSTDLTGTSNPPGSPLNPLLTPLGYYGGPTQTMALLPGSPALATFFSQDPHASTTDQRGEPLYPSVPANFGIRDIGAFESQGFILTTPNGFSFSTPVNTLFSPLVVGVAAINPLEPVD